MLIKGGNGFTAEYAVLPSKWLHQPTSLNHLESSAVPCAALTAYQAIIEVLQISAGQTILITGAAGGVGSLQFKSRLISVLMLLRQAT